MLREQDKPNPFNHPDAYEADRLRSRVAELEAEIETHKQVLRRYEWLRENPAWESEAFLGTLTPAEFDAAVDAAMRDG